MFGKAFEDVAADEKMDKVAHLLEEEFPDCLFVVIALTDDQAHTRYVSNMTRDDAEEVMENLIDQFEEERLNGGRGNQAVN